jgi:hypothetical protein
MEFTKTFGSAIIWQAKFSRARVLGDQCVTTIRQLGIICCDCESALPSCFRCWCEGISALRNRDNQRHNARYILLELGLGNERR